MPRTAVTSKQLLKVEGVQDIVDRIGKVMDKTTGKGVKRLYVKGAKVISDEVRSNIRGLSVSPRMKDILLASVVTNEGPENKQNAISAISQPAAIRRLGSEGTFIPNPYWFEYGTVARTSGGGNRGKIQPSPFFRPAIAAKRAEVRDVLITGFKEIVQKAASGK